MEELIQIFLWPLAVTDWPVYQRVVVTVVLILSFACLVMYCTGNAFVMHWGPVIGCGLIGTVIATWLWKLLR